jgi:hypothetical protein
VHTRFSRWAKSGVWKTTLLSPKDSDIAGSESFSMRF